MFNLINFEHVSRLSIEIEPDQHRQIKMLAASEGVSIKDLILGRTIGAPKKVTPAITELKMDVDEAEYLFSSAVNFKRLRGAVRSPEDENTVFESTEELRNVLGI